MATIITKNSQTASAVPSAASLAVGELAVNTADGKLYTEHTGGIVKEIIPSTVVDGGITATKISNGAVTIPKISATGTASNSTFLRGDGVWQSADSSALAANYTLSSGASLVANRVAALRSDGSVAPFSAPPAEGTKTTNFTGQNLSSLFQFGTRGCQITLGSGYNPSVTLNGYYVTGTGRVSGSSTNIGTASGATFAGSYFVGSDTQVEGVGYFYRYGYDVNYENNYAAFLTVTVDSSGNTSAGSSTNNRSTLGLSLGTGIDLRQIADNLFFVNSGNYSLAVFPKTAGNPAYYSNKLSEYQNLGSDGQTFFVNSNTVLLRLRTDCSITRCVWTGSSIGSPTNQSLISGNSCVWTVNPARTRAFAAYKDAEGNLKVSGFTINESTGALSLVSTYIYQKVWDTVPHSLTWVSDTYLVLTVYLQASTSGAVDYHIAFQTDASGNILNAGSRTTRMTSGVSEYFGLSGNFIAQGQDSNSSRITWTPASTTGWVAPNIAGIARSTTSTSPASIVFNGVMSGFTGLVAGSKYYLADALDGTITTAIPTVTYPTEIGTAISATDLNIALSSFNPNTLQQYTLVQARAIGAYFSNGVQSSETLPAGTWREMSVTNGGNGTVRLYLRIA